MKTTLLIVFLVLGVAAAGFWLGYSPQTPDSADEATDAASGEGAPLGPVDGHDLAATDVERVALDTEAPDFRLLAYSGDVVSLSDFRGSKDVVLVFYRGHW